VRINGPILKDKAKELSKKIGNHGFKETDTGCLDGR